MKTLRITDFMDSKGQAFDVFKLLIAAVIAGAILVILLQILGPLITPTQENPNSVASTEVKTQTDNLGLPVITKLVTFQPQDSLSARTIAEKSGSLSAEQVCVITTESTPNLSAFTANDGKVVIYNGNSGQRAKLLVLCDRQESLSETLTTYEYDDKFGLDTSVSNCEFGAPSALKVCLVAVVST